MTMFTCVSLSEVPKKDGLGSWQLLKQSRVHYHFLLLKKKYIKQGFIWSTVKVKAFAFFHIFSIQSFCVMNRPVFISQCYNHNNVPSIWKSQACFIMCSVNCFCEKHFWGKSFGLRLCSCGQLQWFNVRLCLFWTASGVPLRKRWEMGCRVPAITWTRKFTAHATQMKAALWAILMYLYRISARFYCSWFWLYFSYLGRSRYPPRAHWGKCCMIHPRTFLWFLHVCASATEL